MSTSIQIDGTNFLPIKDAAKLVSYTRDYVARLAREEKIVAKQIGRQWFVDTISLKNFAEAVALEQEVRKRELSLERKREQVVKQVVLDYKTVQSKKRALASVQARMIAFLVLGCGLTAGLGIHTAMTLVPSASSSVAQIAMTLPLEKTLVPEPAPVERVFVEPVRVVEVVATTSIPLEQPLFVDEAETRVMSQGEAEGIFILGENSDVRELEDVQALFSDEVGVRFLNDTTGVVTYVGEEGEVSEFPFVSVSVASNPVDTTE